MPDDSMQELLKEAYKERDDARAEVEIWRNQWKGYQKAKENFWTIDIQKPRFALGKFRLLELVARMMTQDMETLYKWYLIISMACIIATAISQIARNLRELP